MSKKANILTAIVRLEIFFTDKTEDGRNYAQAFEVDYVVCLAERTVLGIDDDTISWNFLTANCTATYVHFN